MYEIEYSAEAENDLAYFRAREQRIILNGIEQQLRYEPTVETRNRFRRSSPEIAEWELRIGQFRVYYDVAEAIRIVSVERIGLKPGNELYLRGRRTGQS